MCKTHSLLVVNVVNVAEDMALWNDYGISNWAILLITPFILLYVYFDFKFRYWRRRGVPSPTLLDYLKQVYDVTWKAPYQVYHEQYKKYGRIYGYYMATTPRISVGDPILLKQILVKDFHIFLNREKFEGAGTSMFSSSLVSLQDEQWKRVRSVVSPTYTSRRIRKMAYLVRECAENFTKHTEKIAVRNEEVDCKTFYTMFAIEIIASAAFGTKINSFENPDHPFVIKAKTLFGFDALRIILMQMLCPPLMKFFKIENFFQVMLYFRDFTLNVIDERDKNNIHADDFLQLMLDAHRGRFEKSEEDKDEIQILSNSKTLSFDEMLAQCVVFLSAGGESTSNVLSIFSYLMALNPDCQQRLIEEIDETWEKNEEINFDVLSQMVYLDACISETLRLFPPGVQLLRICSEDYKLGDTGITIEKGTTVTVPVEPMHHDPEFFPDPEKFNPERFMPENRKYIPPYVYLPFGEGPRHCVAQRFVLMKLKMCVAHLLRRIRFEATENTKRPLKFCLGHPQQPREVMVRLIKRGVLT